MDDWLDNLPVTWMAVVMLTMVYLGTGRDFRDHHVARQRQMGPRFQRRVARTAESLGDYLWTAGRIYYFSSLGRLRSCQAGGRSRIQRTPDNGTAGYQLSGRTGDTDSQPGPPPYRGSRQDGMARDGE